MILIETMELDGNKISFYNGIDFDVIKNHPNDGTNGFIFCFIENFVTEVQSHKRHNKINSVLKSDICTEFNSKDLENNYVAIYQFQDTELDILVNVIKEKVINKNFPEHPWIPISGLKTGAWRIVNSKFLN